MDVPFNYINGEKINLSNPSHIDTIIQRNKEFKTAKETGIHLEEIDVTEIRKVYITCLKCGLINSGIYKSSLLDFDEEHYPNVECNHCKIMYQYDYDTHSYLITENE